MVRPPRHLELPRIAQMEDVQCAKIMILWRYSKGISLDVIYATIT